MPSKQHWKPTICEAPDIPSLSDDLISEFIQRVMFHSALPDESKTRAQTIGYLRLVDKTTYEYRNGRACLERFVKSKSDLRFNILLDAASHFETCINSMKRATNYLEALRRLSNGPNISKNVAVLRGSNRLTRVRDAIEHTDKDILNNTVNPGDPHVLMIEESSLALGGERIQYSELARWLEQLHDQARIIWEHYSK